jgi:hypothetical protein
MTPHLMRAVCVSFCLVSQLSAQDCIPECRRGFECVNGECVSACNPPCPAEYHCDPSLRDCVPNTPPEPAYTPPPPPQEVPDWRSRGCSGSGDCPSGKVCVDNDCESVDWVTSSGNVIFGSTVVLYAGSAVYSSVVPIFLSYRGYHDERPDYYDSYYYEENYHTYEKDDVIICIGPQSGGFMLFGALNQIAKSRQARNLRGLGAKPASNLIGLGVLMYGLSVATMGLHCASYLSDEPGFVRTTGFINAAVQLSSFAVNVSGYYKQIGMLEEAVRQQTGKQAEGRSLQMLPYAGALGGRAVAGLAFTF